MGSPQEERGKRGSLSGPHGSILEKNASACRVGPGHIRRPPDVPLSNERSKTGQGFKSFVHSNMLPQPYAASSLFAATNNFTVGRSWPCRLFFARGRKLTIISRHRQIDARAPFCPGAIVK